VNPVSAAAGVAPPALEWQAANLVDEPVAALARHRQVADEDVWAFALQGLERLVGRAHSRYSRAAAFEHRDDPHAEGLVVVDHKDTDAAEIHIIVQGVTPHIVASQAWAIHEAQAKRHGVAGFGRIAWASIYAPGSAYIPAS